MGVRWNPLGFHLPCYLLLIILVSQIQGYWAVNSEGLALLQFKAGVYSDPDGALANWDPNHDDPCRWSGVRCINGEVYILNLTGFCLKGIVSPELGKLSHLRSLLLGKNLFFGNIPKEIGNLTELDLLDLSDNNLSGKIPAELGGLVSLKHLLLCGNSLEGRFLSELERLSLLSELQVDESLKSSLSNGARGISGKFGDCIWQSRSKTLRRTEALSSKASCCNCAVVDTAEPQVTHNIQSEINVNVLRRKLLKESSNLEVPPASRVSLLVPNVLVTRSSGAFPAVPSENVMHKAPPPPRPQENDSGTESMDKQQLQSSWKYIVIITSSIAVLCLIALGICIMHQKQGTKTIAPWKTGISGQLQKAFVTGVPKLNRPELETACEDFSNIIGTLHGSIVYKGTLSSGVEIAVASTTISLKDWAPNVEKAYRKKIDTLSRVNHKNFVNLIGYCEEDEPFTRMMVFEYAPNGTLFEHLHLKEAEPLDWNVRMRIIMGITYCLQYMHHEINPPVAHCSLNSAAIFLTDDYAAKVAEVNIWLGASSKSRTGEDKSEHSELLRLADPKSNVYDFGLILLEIISGKLPYSEEKGALVDLVAEHLNNKRSITYLIDPTLKSFKNDELDVICEVIQDCIKSEPRHRPTMKEITLKLREVITISPEQATPRISPLWWAELEILSVEAN